MAAGPRAALPEQIPRWRIWVLAARLPTLPAAAAPVVVGTALAISEAAWRPLVFAAALLSALLIQIGTNIANDLYDHQRGADHEERTGPLRVTQAGLVTTGEAARAMWGSYALAALFGIYLIVVGGVPILLVGIASIACGILYTGGPWPLGYHGLGDLFVFLFFGLIAVGGTYYLHSDHLSASAFWVSLPMSALVTAILVVNNLRDIHTDRTAGKHTLAVLLGRRGTQTEFVLLLTAAYVAPVILAVRGIVGGYFWLPWLTLPLGIGLIRAILRDEGVALNRALKGTAALDLFYGIFLSASLLIR